MARSDPIVESCAHGIGAYEFWNQKVKMLRVLEWIESERPGFIQQMVSVCIKSFKLPVIARKLFSVDSCQHEFGK